MKKLSVIIPAYNEQNTIYEVLTRVHSVQLVSGIEKEIIVVNDRSTDNTQSEITRFTEDFPGIIRVILHKENSGKGGAVHTGIENATGDYIIFQDADLELYPEEYNLLLSPIIEDQADVVYGSRFLKSIQNDYSGVSKFANKVLTTLSNVVFGIRITDMETCYKLVPSNVLKSLVLEEKRFGFEPEITAKLAKMKQLRWEEVPITYSPRTNLQGKKIGWKDGFRAVFCIVKYGWFTSKRKSIRP